MKEDKSCLQRDVTEVEVSRRSAGKTCLMFVVIPRCTVSTEQWSIHGNFCNGGLSRGDVVPALFSCLTRCMRKRKRSTRWLWYGLVDRARCVSRDVTLHRLSVLIGLVDKSPSRWPSASQCESRKHIIHVLNLSQSVVFTCVPRTSHCST